MNSSHKTAVLVFANSSKEELLHKPIPKSAFLFKALNKNALKKAEQVGLPYFHFTEREQQGHSFGDRFTNAIQSVFDLGFENVITIGNDTPQLKVSHLLETRKALEAGKTVLGPSLDGGFYLMGLHRANFQPETFKRLPWQRFSLFCEISSLFTDKAVHLFHLPVLQDIDSEKDVISALNFSRSISFSILKALSSIVKSTFVQFIEQSLFHHYLYFSLPFNKGSPFITQQ